MSRETCLGSFFLSFFLAIQERGEYLDGDGSRASSENLSYSEVILMKSQKGFCEELNTAQRRGESSPRPGA